MKLHANASLTIKQRRELEALYDGGHSVKELVQRYGVHETTVRRWSKRSAPFDRSSAPHTHRRVVTDAYREAVIAYRQAHPYAGPIRIAQALVAAYPQAHRGTVGPILRAAGLTHPRRKKAG